MVELSLEEGEDGPQLVLTKSTTHCFACGDPLFEGKFQEIGGKNICNECIKTSLRKDEN